MCANDMLESVRMRKTSRSWNGRLLPLHAALAWRVFRLAVFQPPRFNVACEALGDYVCG